MSRLDQLTGALTRLPTFDRLVSSEYLPSLNVSIPEALELADAYDAAQKAANRTRRAHRWSSTRPLLLSADMPAIREAVDDAARYACRRLEVAFPPDSIDGIYYDLLRELMVTMLRGQDPTYTRPIASQRKGLKRLLSPGNGS